MNLHTEFSDAYCKHAWAYMNYICTDLCGYQCNYTDTYIHTYFYNNSGHEVQMDVADYYQIPTAICCLVESQSIVKLHANILRLGINMDINWDNIPHVQIGNSCSQCGRYINHDKRMWINTQGDEFCKACYRNAIEDNPENKFTETIKYVNMLDFVLFMEEDTGKVIEDKRNQSSKFYVNCNPRSPYYGSIINREVCYADDHIDYIYHADQLLDQITEWLEWVPREDDYDRPDEFISDTMLSVDYVQACETFLHKTSDYARAFSAFLADTFISANITNKFFLENRDVRFIPYIRELRDIQMYKQNKKELNDIKHKAVRHAEEMLLDIMQYKNHKCRSFTRMQLKFK